MIAWMVDSEGKTSSTNEKRTTSLVIITMGARKNWKVSTCILILFAVAHLFFFRSIMPVGRVQLNPKGSLIPSDELDSTVIITSNLIPIHPSLEMINRTIHSLQFINGLPKGTKIIITVDGLYKNDQKNVDAEKTQRLQAYLDALRSAYGNRPEISIMPQQLALYLVGSVQKAMDLVETEFVYLIQHDMSFISPIDHRALVQTFRDYPNEVRLIRFSPKRTLTRDRDKLGLCGDNLGLEANGIALAKTHTWSDNNHFTRKSYYDEMWTLFDDWSKVRYMETKMADLGEKNCSYWGTYLYGKLGQGPPIIIHEDGRRKHVNETSTES